MKTGSHVLLALLLGSVRLRLEYRLTQLKRSFNGFLVKLVPKTLNYTMNNNKNIRPESICTRRMSLRQLFALEGKTPPENGNPLELVAQLAQRFDFLPGPISFKVNGDSVIIKHRRESESATRTATELAHLAVERENEGNHKAAIELWQRALAKQPSLHGARRDLAHAYTELGDFKRAKPLLLQVVRSDPEDAWALIALGIICEHERDYESAERFGRLVLAIQPNNSAALNNLAIICEKTDRAQEALPLYRRAIELDPEMPNPYYRLAQYLAVEGRFSEAAAALERLLTTAGPKSQASPGIIDSARETFVTCQDGLAQQNHLAATELVRQLQAETSKLTGCPIEVIDEAAAVMLGGSGVVLGWDNDCDHHVVSFQREGPEYLRPHLVAGALLMIQVESKARAAGKRRIFEVSEEQQRNMLSLFEPLPAELCQDWFEGAARAMLMAPFHALIGSAPCMLVESRLRQQFPVLRPAQFLSLRDAVIENWQGRHLLGDPPPRMPRALERAYTALMGLQCLFFDGLTGGVTAFAAYYQDLEAFSLSRKLWQHWQSKAPGLQAGDHYAMVDDFADIVGLSGRFGWLADPFTANGAPPPSVA